MNINVKQITLKKILNKTIRYKVSKNEKKVKIYILDIIAHVTLFPSH